MFHGTYDDAEDVPRAKPMTRPQGKAYKGFKGRRRHSPLVEKEGEKEEALAL